MTIKANEIRALPGKVLIKNLQFGERKTHAGLILTDDNGIERGIRPRWAEVFRIGEGVEDVNVGDWILISHGRWSRAIEVELDGANIKINLVDYPDGILMISDQPMYDER